MLGELRVGGRLEGDERAGGERREDCVDPLHAAIKLDRLLAEWVSSIETAGQMLVLRTPPGSANLVASSLDAAGIEGVAGTIAGDDTIMVITTGPAASRKVAARLLAYTRKENA